MGLKFRSELDQSGGGGIEAYFKARLKVGMKIGSRLRIGVGIKGQVSQLLVAIKIRCESTRGII